MLCKRRVYTFWLQSIYLFLGRPFHSLNLSLSLGDLLARSVEGVDEVDLSA